MSVQSSSFLRRLSAFSAIVPPVGFALFLLASPLRADTVVNYAVSGSIPSALYQYDGSTLAASTVSGTVQIDETTSTLTADLLLTGGITGEYLASSSASNAADYFYPNLTDIFAIDSSADYSTPATSFPFLELVLSGDLFTSTGSLPIVTSANASLYEDDTNIGFYSVSSVGQGEGQFIDLTSGSVTPADSSPVPEPGSLVLFGSGLAALAAGARRFCRI